MRIAGIGLRAGASLATLQALLAQGEALTGARVMALVAPLWRADHRGLRALAQARALPLRFVAVTGIATPTQSPRILARHGTGSVAEAAALATGGRLILPRLTAPDGMATLAIAESPPFSAPFIEGTPV